MFQSKSFNLKTVTEGKPILVYFEKNYRSY